MSDSKSSIIGYSGHGLVVAEAARLSGVHLSFYSDLEEKAVNPYALTYLGDEGQENFEHWDKGYGFVLGIGHNGIRTKCALRVLETGNRLINVIHPQAFITKEIEMGEGNFFARGCAINPMVKVGSYCIVNTGTVIEHDCSIGNGVHVGPNATMLGNSHAEEGVFIGAGSVIKQGVKIGKNATIGAGAVILKDVPEGATVVGNPGRIL